MAQLRADIWDRKVDTAKVAVPALCFTLQNNLQFLAASGPVEHTPSRAAPRRPRGTRVALGARLRTPECRPGRGEAGGGLRSPPRRAPKTRAVAPCRRPGRS